MEKTVKCPACTSDADCELQGDFVFYTCPVCGRFELKYTSDIFCQINRNHLAAYLVYHCYINDGTKLKIEYRYNTERNNEWCDQYRKEFDNGINRYGRPVHMDSEIIEAWYPKNFSERVDKILLYIATHTEYIGQTLKLPVNRLVNVLFVDKKILDNNIQSPTKGQWIERNKEEWIQEVNYMLKFLTKNDYIETDEFKGIEPHSIVLTPKGYARVDELQKNTANGRSVLVAMSFRNTKDLREAIRKGITDAGYDAVFIDEVQHNEFITPELLKHIRDSKFVVVDLTHKNNGAYFEEGYAMGLGKPVIQLCQSGVTLHFDIAQKNTIIWKEENDIPERLCNRIKATIQ